MITICHTCKGEKRITGGGFVYRTCEDCGGTGRTEISDDSINRVSKEANVSKEEASKLIQKSVSHMKKGKKKHAN